MLPTPDTQMYVWWRIVGCTQQYRTLSSYCNLILHKILFIWNCSHINLPRRPCYHPHTYQNACTHSHQIVFPKHSHGLLLIFIYYYFDFISYMLAEHICVMSSRWCTYSISWWRNFVRVVWSYNRRIVNAANRKKTKTRRRSHRSRSEQPKKIR